MTILNLYLGFLIIGMLGLFGSLIFGDYDEIDLDGDVDSIGSDSPKIFSLRIIFSFLLAFSLGGGALFLMEKSLGIQLIGGFAAGFIIAFLLFQATKYLYSLQGNSNTNADDFIGNTAYVTIGTIPNGNLQVQVHTHGGDSLFTAQAVNGEKLKRGDAVKIESRIGTKLLVSKL